MKLTLLYAISFFKTKIVPLVILPIFCGVPIGFLVGIVPSCIAQHMEDAAQAKAVAAFDKAHPPALPKAVVASPAAPVASGLDQVDAGLTEAQDDIGGTTTALVANDVPAATASNAKAAVAVAGAHAKVKSLVPGAKANEKNIEDEQEYPILRGIFLWAFWIECAGAAIFLALSLLQSITFVAMIAGWIGLGASTLLEISGWLVLAAIGAMYAYYHIVLVVDSALVIGLVAAVVLAVRWGLHNKAKVKALEADAEDAADEAEPAIKFVESELAKAGHYMEGLGLTVLQKLHILKATVPSPIPSITIPNVPTPAATSPQAPKILG